MSKDNKVSTLTKATVKAITEIATAQAIKAYNDEKKSDVQKYHDRRYKNTKLLLKNYHKFVEYRNNAIYDASKVEGNVIIAEIMEESPEGNFSAESIKKNVVITPTMLAHIDEMLKVYENRCNRSSKPEVHRRWRVLKAMHLSEDEGNVDDIAEKENCSSRLIQYDLKKIYEELSELFFGIDFNDMLQ